ncbi:MAG: hypothetical protein ABEJ02_03010 [Candidatus Paceibacteria bacterium]
MTEECSVCLEEKRRSNMTFLDPIEDWICNSCLAKGRQAGVNSLEDGQKLTEMIRNGEV